MSGLWVRPTHCSICLLRITTPVPNPDACCQVCYDSMAAEQRRRAER